MEQEDGKRPHRERKRLGKEQTGHINRIRGLLVQRGIYGGNPLSRKFRTKMDEMRCGDGLPLAPHLKAEIEHELDRLASIYADNFGVGPPDAQKSSTSDTGWVDHKGNPVDRKMVVPGVS